MSAAAKVQHHPVYVQASNKANYYVGQLDKELSKYPIMHTFEERTQVPKVYVATGSIVLITLLLLVNPLASPVSNVIGWALPAYQSFRAIETSGAQDDVQWLTYWVIFGFFNLLESLALKLVLYYIPWYFSFKTIFVLWLQLPAFQGAQSTYHSVLKPLLAHVQGESPAAFASTASANLRDDVHSVTSG